MWTRGSRQTAGGPGGRLGRGSAAAGRRRSPRCRKGCRGRPNRAGVVHQAPATAIRTTGTSSPAASTCAPCPPPAHSRLVSPARGASSWQQASLNPVPLASSSTRRRRLDKPETNWSAGSCSGRETADSSRPCCGASQERTTGASHPSRLSLQRSMQAPLAHLRARQAQHGQLGEAPQECSTATGKLHARQVSARKSSGRPKWRPSYMLVHACRATGRAASLLGSTLARDAAAARGPVRMPALSHRCPTHRCCRRVKVRSGARPCAVTAVRPDRSSRVSWDRPARWAMPASLTGASAWACGQQSRGHQGGSTARHAVDLL